LAPTGVSGPQVERLGEAVQRPPGLGRQLDDEVIQPEPFVRIDRPGDFVDRAAHPASLSR
jgi:hypothetical protein